MSCSRVFSSSLYLLITLAFLLRTAFGASSPYIYHYCSSSQNYTSNGPYESNLNKLAAYLNYQTPPTGFGKGALGHKPNQANGLALCRGDVSSSDCKTCVVEASSEIRMRCPYNKAAIIWYDYCLYKYSDKHFFFGQIDNQNKVSLYNVRSVSEPEAFNKNTRELLSQLAKEAHVASKLYAVAEVELGESKKLYGLTQCTKDLSSYECKKCLDGIIGELPRCCDGKEGGPSHPLLSTLVFHTLLDPPIKGHLVLYFNWFGTVPHFKLRQRCMLLFHIDRCLCQDLIKELICNISVFIYFETLCIPSQTLDATVAGSTRDENRAGLRAVHGDLDLNTETFTRKAGFMKNWAVLRLVIIDFIIVYVLFDFWTIFSRKP
ncbi:hypothetical protein LWI29_014089 [Acer saccharum]|uniref:Gnk2-homologous domain-containing protein n=1 Tax=Acer saccharum TaxID=4024 RepID=A0AA39SDX5_ACESA|nr:hypothetical protein LWI29_014089 [Acer saccharum]